MSEKSKTIGVVAPRIYDGFTKQLILGINQRAAEFGYSTAIFSTASEVKTESLDSIGEMNIYNLINFDTLDGLIYLRKCFFDDIPLKHIDELLKKKCRCPAVSISSEDPLLHSIEINHKEYFRELTEHMITEHGCRTIYCLMGFENNIGTDQRIAGFKDAMHAHGLEYSDDWITYGDYWKDSARAYAEKLIAAGTLPDAVICANDTMACELANTLIANGIRIPEDIAVAGYDSDFSACMNIPSVTTYIVPNDELGARAVDYIHEQITGRKRLPPFVSGTRDFSSNIIAGESCGCKRNFRELSNYVTANIKPREFNRMLYSTSNISSSLSSASTMVEYIDRFNRLTYVVDGGTELISLCLCNDWSVKNNKEYRTDSYPEEMMCKLSKNPQRIISVDKRFPTKEMHPWLTRKKPAAYYFMPLHFLDRCLGYCVLSYGSSNRIIDDTFASWCTTISTTLEYLRVRVYINERNTHKLNIVAKAIHNSIREESPAYAPEKTVLGYAERDVKRIPINDIYYFSADNTVVSIHCDGMKYKSKQKLYELENLCSDGAFFRISKSKIVNVSKISGLSINDDGGHDIIMCNGEKHKVSRRRTAALKRLL